MAGGSRKSDTFLLCVIPVLSIILTSVLADDKCTVCKDIVNNIMEGIKKTAKSNFGGGNTNWEERSLGSYTFSETRLLEILENACKDSTKECHSMLEEEEETIENWWFKLYAKGEEKDLLSYLCIRRTKLCCDRGTYGPDCADCRGGRKTPCKGTGKCSGDGTREGTGACICDSGYEGELCDECLDNYYEESKNDTHTVCKQCHNACKSGCESGGPEGCEDCVEGWDYLEDQGCQDVNECEKDDPCTENQYCTNTPGSYRCSACSVACSGCTSSGPSSCVECASRYFRIDDVCNACHRACESSCTDFTAKSCDQCGEGWTLSADKGCIDVDECQEGTHTCDEDEYCTNTEGSFKCPNCHYACKTCSGPGSNDCLDCNTGYTQGEDGFCTDVDECDASDSCPGEQSQCVNTPGSYKCTCTPGYDMKDGACVQKPQDSSPKKSRKSSSSSSDSSQPEKSSSDKSDSKKKKNKKKSDKKSSKKNLKKALESSYWQFWLALCIFGLVGIFLKNSVFAQLIFTASFWLYLFWFGMKVDKVYKKS